MGDALCIEVAELTHHPTMEETNNSAGNDAVRRFRARQKVKEQEDKEKRERLKKENQEIEERMACYQQELAFLTNVMAAHVESAGAVVIPTTAPDINTLFMVLG